MDEMEDLYEDMADLNAAWKSLTSKPRLGVGTKSV